MPTFTHTHGQKKSQERQQTDKKRNKEKQQRKKGKKIYTFDNRIGLVCSVNIIHVLYILFV